MKQPLNTAWLVLFVCATLALVRCAKEDPKLISNEDAVIQAKTALEIGYGDGDSMSSVTTSLTLPTTGIGNNGEGNGVGITWISSNSDIISVSEIDDRDRNLIGTVTRLRDMNTEVTLTATLTKGGASDTKEFILTVIITDAGAVEQAMRSLEISYGDGDSDARVTKDITLPTELNGVIIAWESEPIGIVSTAEATLGEVTRPNDMDTVVTLTATLTKGGARNTKKFPLFTVIISVDGQAVKDAKSSLAIGYSAGDDVDHVIGDITLPTEWEGVTIFWTAQPRGIVSTAEATLGEVTRPNGMDTEVRLTATLRKGSARDTKEFMPTVLTVPATDAIAVTRAKERLKITYSSGDSDAGVKEDLTLLTEGLDGVSISWTAEPTGIVSTAEATLGEVTRPGNMHTVVTLTATLTKGTGTEMVSDTKEFTLTVLADNPRLINIESIAQLIAMRHDPDGNGMVDADEDGMVDETAQTAYGKAFPGLDTAIAWEGYELMVDLDLDPELPGGSDWTPQSNIATNFEGNGYTISNMTIRVSGEKRSFFSNIGSGGHVRNLNLRDVSVNGHQRNGGLAGLNAGTVTSCSTTGRITTSGWFNGGLVGENTGTIMASYSEVAITGRGNETAGLVGFNRGKITASYATGNVTGGGRSTGGLVGDNIGTITASYATGDVTATGTRSRHGGLVGFSRNMGAVIKASYATGNVKGVAQNEVGGLVGRNDSDSTITASYSTGTVTGAGSDVGGLVGKNDGTVTASYFDSTTSGITTGERAKTTSQLQTPKEYGTGTAIYSAWNIDVDNGFARGVDNGSAAGDATADDPWDFGTSSQYPVLKVDFDGDGTAGAAEFGSQR